MSLALDAVKAEYVTAQENNIEYGGQSHWVDVEADEVDLAKKIHHELVSTDEKPVSWEQWCGVLQRGRRKRSSCTASARPVQR